MSGDPLTEAVAYHEAAHAVAAVALRRPVGRVLALPHMCLVLAEADAGRGPEPSWVGITETHRRWARARWSRSEWRRRADIRISAVISLAGAAADEERDRRRPDLRDALDRWGVQPGTKRDLEEAAESVKALYPGASVDTHRRHMERLLVRARRLITVPRTWTAVEQVAQLLCVRRRGVSGRTVQARVARARAK